MLDFIINFIKSYEDIFVWIGIVSAIVFVATLLFTPYLLGLIPEDYFINENGENSGNIFVKILKNIIGLLLVLVGVIMLITPGQGVISILLGLFLMEFPGKRKLELKLISNDSTFKAINWLRDKAKKQPIKR